MADANKGAGRVRITVEFLDQTGSPWVVEADGFEVSQEAGIHRHHTPGNPVGDINHNGQQRLLIKAWKGCETYDSFQPETESIDV